jgi:predicted NBD/HSP70 family sugar kinase
VAAEGGGRFETLPIGVGMPGGLRRRDGTIKNSNTTCLNGRPFRSDLIHVLGRDVRFDNDANCFALAETLMGAARGCQTGIVFGVILGTGVGGGVVVGGRVWGGLQGIAGEWGHHEVYGLPSNQLSPALRTCYCGRAGCLETYASGPAVERDYAQRTGQLASLSEIAKRRSHDPNAGACIDQLLDALGRGLATVVNTLDPSMIVLGGGVSNLDLLYEEVANRVREHLFNDELLTPIVRHRLGDSAGVLGAALLGETG